MDSVELERGLRAGFIDAETSCSDEYRPLLVHNDKAAGTNLLSVIKRQLATCDSFHFCVAFVAESGLQPLVEVLTELRERGIRGKLLTSTYLNFNSPAVFRKLLEYDNIETRVYLGNLHAKGYLFNKGETSTVIVGSSNLTQTALTCNQEWNVLFRSYDRGGVLLQVSAEFDSLWSGPETVVLSGEWVDEYEEYRSTHAQPAVRRATFSKADIIAAEYESIRGKVVPNAMQRQALEALAVLHGRGEERALLVSATGTGKTYLSAFDVAATKPRRVLFLAHRRRILEASLKSYKKLLGDAYSYALYDPSKPCEPATCLFAMCSTICRHLNEFDSCDFDYIVIDEAHRTGAGSYRAITSYFAPKFYLGMTATPNRTNNDYDVFALFNHVIAFQISLQDALANDMLAPFHYFGIADVAVDDESLDNVELFARLSSDERVRHVTKKIEEYTVDKGGRKGLVFCSRNEEARELSNKFNALGYRTAALSGADSDERRSAIIEGLESGELEYVFSVDILNEGVDIPSVNQIIMLRRTESAIVFVQQLGRGLRKAEGKDYTLVLDFIGNYQKNYFVPVALSGDHTYNKDGLRRVVQNGSSVIPGCSTVSFDRVSEARIYKAIDGGKFTDVAFLRSEYANLRQMFGRIPTLEEFDANDSIDPLLIFKKFGSYHAFLKKYEKGEYGVTFTRRQEDILAFVSRKLANGKRAEELKMLETLIEDYLSVGNNLRSADVAALDMGHASVRSAARVLAGEFSSISGEVSLVTSASGAVALSDTLRHALEDGEFARQLLEVIRFGSRRNAAGYASLYKDTSFVLYGKYTYEEVCRLLGWSTNVNGQNIGGYKYDADTNTFPVFINYDKSPDISDSIKYEDRFVSEDTLIAISKQPRSLTSPEILRLQAWPGNHMRVFLFVRKNKDDGDSKEFYFLGEMGPVQSGYRAIKMPGTDKSAVEITYRLERPVRQDLYSYITSDLSEA